jgi:hypothetical protein
MHLLSFIILQAATPPASFTDILGVTALVLVFIGGIFLLAWPSLKENNIFKKGRIYNYGKGEHAKIYLRARERDTLAFTIVANIAGVILLSYLAIQIKSEGINYHITDTDRLPLRLFGLGLFCTCCLFVYALFGELELDLIRNFTYSLKVWLTALFASPLVFFAIHNSKIIHSKYLVYLYFKTVVTASGIGFVTFLVLIFGVHYITAKPLNIRQKRKHIALLTQASVLFSVVVACLIIRSDINWFFIWLTYAVIIGLGTRFYSMNTTVYTETVYYEAEVID